MPPPTTRATRGHRPAAPAGKAPGNTANRVRIIGGRWKRRLLRFPGAAAVRPTPDRVRETLFNWLGQDLTGLATLDLFAGSGALSFESLSRGAALAVAVDASRDVIAALRDNAAVLGADGLEAHRANASDFLAAERRRFDVIYVDPPFAEDWLPRLWTALAARIAPGGMLYVEQPAAVAAPPGWTLSHHRRAGRVHYHLLRFEPERPPTEASTEPTGAS
jgi:16S rRNA (guanine966-N2)-methyltransferase